MKKNSIMTRSIGFICILLLALSCQKNQEQPQQTPPSNSGSTIQLKTVIDTLHIEDSLWVQEVHNYGAGGSTWSVAGDYYSNLTQLVGERQVIDVWVNVYGEAKLVGSSYTLPYKDGFFKRNGSILYFSGPYGQLSFRSVEIDIVVKD